MNQLDDSISIMFCLQMTNAVLMIQFFRVFQFFRGKFSMFQECQCFSIFALQFFNVSGVSVFEDEDEALADAALSADVFTFIRNCIVANPDFHREVWQSDTVRSLCRRHQ